MAQMAGPSELPLIWHTSPPNGSLEQPVQGENWRVLDDTNTMARYPQGPPRRHFRSFGRSLKRRVRGLKRWRTMIELIEALPEDVLLEIFDFYRLDAMVQSQGRPWKWHRLAHVCQKWRHVLSMSPRRLDLRILCEHGESIQDILAAWPTLPLVAKFNVDPESNYFIPWNVMVALHQPDRLCEIELHVTSSMLASIVEVTQKPCQALESIRITVEALTGPSMLVGNAFLGGSAPHLRELKLDGIAFPFPAIRQVLLSTSNLVELHLGHIPNDAYFSPNELVTGLSTSVQLERLTIDFHSLSSSTPLSMTRPPHRRTALPCLMSLDFHGASGYLEEFVAQIDLLVLCKFSLKFFNDIFFDIPQFCKLIHRLNALRPPTQVIVRHCVDAVGVHFEDFEGKLSSESSFLGTSCRQLDWQLSFVIQILGQLSFFLSSVRSLDIQSGDKLPTGEEDVDSTEWVELFGLFTHVTQVYVWDRLVPGIVPALITEDMTVEVLPELTSLHLGQYRNSPSVAKAAEQFIAMRKLSSPFLFLTSGDEFSPDRKRPRSPVGVAELRQWEEVQLLLQQQQFYQQWEEESELEWNLGL